MFLEFLYFRLISRSQNMHLVVLGNKGCKHCLLKQHCLETPVPPNFFMSLQYLHSLQSSLVQASHVLQRTLRRRSIFDFGTLSGRSRFLIEPFVLGVSLIICFRENSSNDLDFSFLSRLLERFKTSSSILHSNEFSSEFNSFSSFCLEFIILSKFFALFGTDFKNFFVLF